MRIYLQIYKDNKYYLDVCIHIGIYIFKKFNKYINQSASITKIEYVGKTFRKTRDKFL